MDDNFWADILIDCAGPDLSTCNVKSKLVLENGNVIVNDKDFIDRGDKYDENSNDDSRRKSETTSAVVSAQDSDKDVHNQRVTVYDGRDKHVHFVAGVEKSKEIDEESDEDDGAPLDEDDDDTDIDDGDTLTTSCSTATHRCDYDVNPTGLFEAIVQKEWIALSKYLKSNGKVWSLSFTLRRMLSTKTPAEAAQLSSSASTASCAIAEEARTWVVKYRDGDDTKNGIMDGMLRSCMPEMPKRGANKSNSVLKSLSELSGVGAVYHLDDISARSDEDIIKDNDTVELSHRGHHSLRSQQYPIGRRDGDDDDTASFRCRPIQWQQLALHQALIQGAPYKIIEGLLDLYPRAASLTTEPSGMLPLHLAFQYDANDDVVRLIAQHHPVALSLTSNDGMLPVQLAGRRTDRARLLHLVTTHITDKFNQRQENSRTVWNRQLLIKDERCDNLLARCQAAESQLEAARAEIKNLRGQVSNLQAQVDLMAALPKPVAADVLLSLASTPTIVDCTKRLINERLRQTERLSAHRSKMKGKNDCAATNSNNKAIVINNNYDSRICSKSGEQTAVPIIEADDSMPSPSLTLKPLDSGFQNGVDITAHIVLALSPSSKDTPKQPKRVLSSSDMASSSLFTRLPSTLSQSSSSSCLHINHTGGLIDNEDLDSSAIGVEVTRSRSLTRSPNKSDRQLIQIQMQQGKCNGDSISNNSTSNRDVSAAISTSSTSPVKTGWIPSSTNKGGGSAPAPSTSKSSSWGGGGLITPLAKAISGGRGNRKNRSAASASDGNKKQKLSEQLVCNVDRDAINDEDDFPGTIPFSGSGCTVSETSTEESQKSATISVTAMGPWHRKVYVKV